jgi:hypothetical protein
LVATMSGRVMRMSLTAINRSEKGMWVINDVWIHYTTILHDDDSSHQCFSSHSLETEGRRRRNLVGKFGGDIGSIRYCYSLPLLEISDFHPKMKNF